MVATLAALAATVAIVCAPAQRPAHTSDVRSVEAVPPLPSELACPVLRAAPRAVQAAGDEGDGQCDVVPRVRAAFPKSATLPDDEVQALRLAVENAVAAHPRACVAALGRELVKASDCGVVYDGVAIRILNGANVDPVLAAGELTRAALCQWKIVSALREAEKTSPVMVATVLNLTASPDEDVRNAAWMTLGTLERIARSASQSELTACIDEPVAAELSHRTGDARAVLVGAAGNAGCDGCRGSLEKIIDGEEPSLRRSAVAALRYFSDEPAVSRLCTLVRTDKDATVRSSAAYALRHGTSFVESRFACLFESATQDAVDGVSRDAVVSIAELAEKSQLGVGTLVHVMKTAPREQTRKQAAQALRAFATDEAIRDISRSP